MSFGWIIAIAIAVGSLISQLGCIEDAIRDQTTELKRRS